MILNVNIHAIYIGKIYCLYARKGLINTPKLTHHIITSYILYRPYLFVTDNWNIVYLIFIHI